MAYCQAGGGDGGDEEEDEDGIRGADGNSGDGIRRCGHLAASVRVRLLPFLAGFVLTVKDVTVGRARSMTS